jgi:hypothetical protein
MLYLPRVGFLFVFSLALANAAGAFSIRFELCYKHSQSLKNN